jgi:hypothetical protein
MIVVVMAARMAMMIVRMVVIVMRVAVPMR